MRRKKNGFLTFIFSLIPGAGEMYMGFMKQGVSLMTAFFGIIFLYSSLFYTFEILVAILPVIWAYSFFHVHNLRAMPDEQFYAQEDSYLFRLGQIFPKDGKLISQYRKVFAVALIFLGIALLWQSLSSVIRWIIPEAMKPYYNSFVNMLPGIVLSLFMIWSGIWLIRGKKKELYDDSAEENGSVEPDNSRNELITKEGENL